MVLKLNTNMRQTVILYVFFLLSCGRSNVDSADELVRRWNGKEIFFQEKVVFTKLGVDTVVYNVSQYKYRIVTYVDSIGCVSCKLQLGKWKKIIAEFDTVTNYSVPVLFFVHPKKKKEMSLILKRDNFDHPICLDLSDSFNDLNKFPSGVMFQTFLLDKNNKVVAIGNPVHNLKVKELYLKIIMGDKAPKKEVKIQTTAMCSNTIIDMGKFDWRQEQKTIFTLTNTGNSLLFVTDVITSCGCTTVDYCKEPVRPGNSVELKVRYKADHPEHFNKTITVYCNAATSPLKLRITGSAE